MDITTDCKRRILANKTYNKVFSVGFNKTGTTTIEDILRKYGFILPKQQAQESRLTKQTFLGNYDPLKEFCKDYDAFQDMPFSQGDSYIVADCFFPKSKFILTERDSESWFNSMINFKKKIYKISEHSQISEQDVIDKFNYLYKGYSHENISRLLSENKNGSNIVRWDLLYDKDLYIKKYEDRNERIKLYFKDRPDDLFVIDVTKEKDTLKLCDFLNIPKEYVMPFTHRNKT